MTIACILSAAACGLPGAPGCSGGEPEPPVTGSSTGSGTILKAGTPRDYAVVGDESSLLLLVRKKDAQACSFFHHHAVAARAVGYAFTLDPDHPEASTLTAEVAASGLDPDDAVSRDQFAETAGTTLPERDRSDIRNNMRDQIAAAEHPTLRFTATNLSTLEGEGTADVAVDVKGRQSTLVMHATARWDGERLVMDGTGTIDGRQHDIPVGTFKDCVEPDMQMKMHIVLAPGRGDATVPDAGTVTQYQRTDFPEEEGACGPLGFEDVRRTVLVRCAGCHANPPVNGATLPLLTIEDFRRDSPMSPGVPLYLDMADRLVDTGGRQMPPATSAQPTLDEKEALLAWALGGGHARACDAGVPPGEDGGAAQSGDGGAVLDGDAGQAACTATGYEDVRGVFAAHCTSCHSAGGGLTPLDSYAAGTAPATHPAYTPMTLWQASLARMEDHSMPPGGATVPDAEVALVRAWVEGGAPEQACSPDPGPPVDGTDAGQPDVSDAGMSMPDAAMPAPVVACSTNSWWTRGDNGSRRMHPGGDCIGCHSGTGGPRFTAAGTVMGALHDETDCNGIGNVRVRIIGSDNSVTEMPTNEAGNFTTSANIARPYRVQLLDGQGRMREMVTPQMDTNCMTCHTQAGGGGAPGRILAP